MKILFLFVLVFITTDTFAQPTVNVGTNGKKLLKDGAVNIKYRGKDARLVCADMFVDQAGDLITNGLVEIFESGAEGRPLSQYTGKGKFRQGSAWEWDYDNSLMHYLYYSNGVLSDTNSIRTIPDKIWVAIGVKYSNPVNDLFIRNIESGTFAFNGGSSNYMVCNTGKCDVAFFKKDYATYNIFDYSYRDGKVVRKTAAEITELGNTLRRENGEVIPEKKYPQYSSGIVAECSTEIQNLRRRFNYALNYYNTAMREEKYYSRNKRAYEGLQKEIIPECETAIAKFKGKVPDDMLYELKDIRDALKKNNLPMGIARNIPTQRNNTE